jgi:hypothetical protein
VGASLPKKTLVNSSPASVAFGGGGGATGGAVSFSGTGAAGAGGAGMSLPKKTLVNSSASSFAFGSVAGVAVGASGFTGAAVTVDGAGTSLPKKTRVNSPASCFAFGGAGGATCGAVGCSAAGAAGTDGFGISLPKKTRVNSPASSFAFGGESGGVGGATTFGVIAACVASSEAALCGLASGDKRMDGLPAEDGTLGASLGALGFGAASEAPGAPCSHFRRSRKPGRSWVTTKTRPASSPISIRTFISSAVARRRKLKNIEARSG